MKILTVHGIDHNMFGQRDPAQYGKVTSADIDAHVQTLCTELGAQVARF